MSDSPAAQQLLAHFDRISEAPDAVPRLRRFILDLAVRGKLVEQDPSDEPAGDLLKHIQAGRARLSKVGLVRKGDAPAPDDPTDAPFAAPAHWAWLPLHRVGVLSGGMTPSKMRSDFWGGRVNWFSPKDIKSDALVESELKITSAAVTETGLQLYPPGCLLMVARSGILKRTFPVAINRVEATVNQDLKVLRPFLGGMERYLQVVFRGMTDYILSALVKTGTTVQSLKYEEFESALVPLPPLAEQHRIVAKVDELMALCDRLEAAQAQRESQRDRLVVASLERLNQLDVAGDGKALREDARFHFRHLPRLTTRPGHIQQLRGTILNLAIRGRLARRDSNDEPALALLQRLGAGKVRPLMSEGITKPPAGQVARELRPPFEVPDSWLWVRVDDCFRVSGGIQKTPARTPEKNAYPYVGVGNVYRGRLDLSVVKEFELLECELEKFRLVKGDILVVEGNGSAREIGRCASWSGEIEECVHQNHIIRCRPVSLELTAYVTRYLNSPTGVQTMKALAVTSSGLYNLSVGRIRAILIPLPPLPEQRRIVAKIDKLMALCDRLEAQLTTAATDSRHLLEAVLAKALDPAA